MQKYYIVTNKKFLEQVARDKKNIQDRNEFIKKFYEENGITGTGYHFRGNGFCNEPFNEHDKDTIRLYIPDNPENAEKFGSQYRTKIEGLCGLRKNSKLQKKFADACIEASVVINLHKVCPGDFFRELNLGGYAAQKFEVNGKQYLHLNTDAYGDKNITPIEDGFEEIKASEFYMALEKAEAAASLN